MNENKKRGKKGKDFIEYAGFLDGNWDESYQTIVEADWLNIGSEVIYKDREKKRLFVEMLTAQGLMTAEQIHSLEAFFLLDSILIEGSNPVDNIEQWKYAEQMKEFMISKQKISEILKGFKNESINGICDTLRKAVFLEQLWTSGSFINQKLLLGLQIKKDLNATKKHLTAFISGAIDKYYNDCLEHLPEIVRKAITDAVAPLAKAHTLTNAYLSLIESELKKYRYSVAELTSRNEWKNIIIEVVNIVTKEIADNPKKYAENRNFSLTAKIFAVAFPWCWGRLSHNSATKKIRERYNRMVEA